MTHVIAQTSTTALTMKLTWMGISQKRVVRIKNLSSSF